MNESSQAAENIQKTFDNVVVEPSGIISMVSDSFGLVDLKMIREFGFEVQRIYKHGSMIKINVSKQEVKKYEHG